MRVEYIDIADPAWGEFVATHPDATPFHLPEWASMIAECYRFDAFVLAVRDAGGELLAGAPTIAVRSPLGRLRWVSLPFSDSCPLLIRPEIGPDEVVEALTHHVLTGPASELEVRAALPAGDGVYPVHVGYNYTIALSPDVSVLHPNKGHRYSRNRARRLGVEVTFGRSQAEVDAFYRMQALTRRRKGVPVQPRRFFELVAERMLAKDLGFVASATLDGEVIAAGIYFGHNGTLMAKYYASDPLHVSVGAGYLIDWEAMVRGCAEGYHTLDLGRSDLDAEGLRLYKSSWGAAEQPLVYTHLSSLAPSVGGPMVGELPRSIIRNSPLWVCRGLGELLYRWSA